MITLGDTYLLEMLEPDASTWKDCGIRSKFKTLEEAKKELESTIIYFNHKYKFRINHITCSEEITFEVNGIQNLLATG
jgi:hypothetical protein